MILRPFAPVSATAIACGTLWLAWTELDLLRGTLLWDLRFVLGGGAAVLVLGLADWLGRDASGTGTEDDDMPR